MDLIKIISSVAPFLGNLLGGPFGSAAGKAIGKILLGNEDASPEEIEKAVINASPEQLIKLKELDIQYRTRLAELGIDERRIAAEDRDSARKREVLRQDYITSLLALIITLGFFGIIIAMMFYPIQPDAKDILNILLGVLGTAWIACVTYYFGSSYEAHNAANDLKIK